MKTLFDLGSFLARKIFAIGVLATFCLFLYGLFTFSAIAAPAAVASMTLGICYLALNPANPLITVGEAAKKESEPSRQDLAS